MSIPFTQFVRPFGLKRPIETDRPPEIENLATQLINEGFRFEIEELTTGKISMECIKRNPNADPEVLASEICQNNPEVPVAVDKMIRESIKALKLKKP